ncbi:hypothetical protein CRE_15657 [Caenorhabditis remanei]|uniref:Uncharacterized protein n=1 Tax=Caenorhabditis remanei TaxID=31234 RepID=E3N860_CAERE|nr:hypothetical protein CRE_15657 [Caenorhabditis remanei]
MSDQSIDTTAENFVDVDQLVFDDNGTTDEISLSSGTERHIDTKKVEKVIDLSSRFLELGKLVFKDVAVAVGNIVGVGNVIKAILKFVPDKPDPVYGKLKNLESKMDELTELISTKFDDMKAFITEVNFYVEVMSPASNLMMLMRDCMKHPDDQAVENFLEAYARHPPLIMAYSVLSLLEYNSTNPLKMSMDADPVKRKSTFNKWYDIIDDVLGEFLILEAFGSGLLEKKNTYNCHRIIEKTEELFKKVEQWKEEYKLPGVMEKLLNENSKLNNDNKADKMKEILGDILTNDAFYLGVFNKWERDRYLHYSFDLFNQNQLIELYGPGDGNAFIYRSRKANTVEEKWLALIKEEVKNVKFDVEEYKKNPKDYPSKLTLQIHNSGFICVMGQLGEVIKPVNCDRNGGEPGYHRLMYSEKDKNGKRAHRELIMLSSYLEHDAINPMKASQSSKGEELAQCVMGILLFLDAFYIGLTGQYDDTAELRREVRVVLGKMDKLSHLGI